MWLALKLISLIRKRGFFKKEKDEEEKMLEKGKGEEMTQEHKQKHPQGGIDMF